MLNIQPQDNRPLPERIRPQNLDDFNGQEHVWNHLSPLKKMIAADQVPAILLWGPPGTGKTTLARIIGAHCQRKIVEISAVHTNVKELRQVIETSKNDQNDGQKSHILFIDEIHRLSKNQQDVLLPGLESGHVKFIGATTENPSFSVNNAILSRCLAFNLKPLSREALESIISRAISSGDPIFQNVHVPQDVVKVIAGSSNGDARQCLNILEVAVSCAENNSAGERSVQLESLAKLGHSLQIKFDRSGDEHFDSISAFIKSIRASHPDAAIYYLARMIEGGEDPLFIARRLLISASEDIGNANPTALLIAESTFRAVEILGLPEARIPLAQCTTYLASSPKSNRSYTAIDSAIADVRASGPLDIPTHLRNAPTKFMKDLGYSANYKYPHADEEGSRLMPYLPSPLKGRRYYSPIPVGTERQLIENLKQLRPTQD